MVCSWVIIKDEERYKISYGMIIYIIQAIWLGKMKTDMYSYMSRKDDVIKSSGYRIGPFEVESVIMEHKSVMECAVTVCA